MKPRITLTSALLMAIMLFTPSLLVGCGANGGETAGKVTKEAASAAAKTLQKWGQQR